MPQQISIVFPQIPWPAGFCFDFSLRVFQGLGLSIVGRKSDVGVYVSDLVKGGVAEHDGRIMTGESFYEIYH